MCVGAMESMGRWTVEGWLTEGHLVLECVLQRTAIWFVEDVSVFLMKSSVGTDTNRIKKIECGRAFLN